MGHVQYLTIDNDPAVLFCVVFSDLKNGMNETDELDKGHTSSTVISRMASFAGAVLAEAVFVAEGALVVLGAAVAGAAPFQEISNWTLPPG